MTLDEFLQHSEYVQMETDLEYAMSKDHELKMKNESKG